MQTHAVRQNHCLDKVLGNPPTVNLAKTDHRCCPYFSLRLADSANMVSCAMMSGSALQQRTALATPLQSRSRVLRAGRPARQTTRALSDTNLVISGATAVSLALGRFVFLDFQRDNARRQGLPQANGVEYSKAGDKLSEEASFLKGTNDPAGRERV